MMISLTKYVLQLLGFLLCYQMSSKYMSSKGVFKRRVQASASELTSRYASVCWAMSGWEKFRADRAVRRIARLPVVPDFPNPRFFGLDRQFFNISQRQTVSI